MTQPQALINILYQNVGKFHNEMSGDEWKRFRADLVRLQPLVDGAAERRARYAAWSDLLDVCQNYLATRCVMPADPPTMWIDAPDPDKPQDEPIRDFSNLPLGNKVIHVIQRMNEVELNSPTVEPGEEKS